MRLSQAQSRRPRGSASAGTTVSSRRPARPRLSLMRQRYERAVMTVRPSIMVVDDESDIRDLLVEWLGDEGYPVHAAASPAAALALLDGNPEIALLLTDIVMPGGLNGFDLARRAQVARPALKVIYISAYSMAEAVAQARPSDEPMLRKPFRLDQVLSEVRRTLGPAAPA